MALYVTPETKKAGETEFLKAVGQSRREFLKTFLAAGAAIPIGAAMYFGYQKLHGNPVRTALIGAGDEGGVLIGNHNPDYLEIVAVCDIRPSNQKRIFVGEPDKPTSPRLGLNKFYGKDADKKIKVYDDYKKLLENKDIEAVIIALPLNIHAQVTIDAMKAGKHVLCEKLMAWNIHQCKQMIRAAREHDKVLSVGHQRHYSMLYTQALEVIKAGHLGEIRHIRALWHRNNTWPRLKDGKPIADRLKGSEPLLRDSWRPEVPKDDLELEGKLQSFPATEDFDTLERLVRWRLFRKTGGGLMAELGSHQLDACSIFLGKVKPLSVSGTGVKSFYKDERDVDDHVFATFEFPGPKYWDAERPGKVANADDRVIVTYSSINTNTFEPYGECVMGTHGTMMVEKEETAALYPEKDPNVAAPAKDIAVTVSPAGGGQPAMASSGSEGFADAGAASAAGQAILGPRPVSRGYREEMEDFAYCVRMQQEAADSDERAKWREGKPGKPGEPRGPRCPGTVAMADAILALTANIAMDTNQRIEFDPKWFALSDNPADDEKEVPEVLRKAKS